MCILLSQLPSWEKLAYLMYECFEMGGKCCCTLCEDGM